MTPTVTDLPEGAPVSASRGGFPGEFNSSGVP
jgi:hypothetical protein